MCNNILITGITGFVGQNLLAYLSENHPEWIIWGAVRNVKALPQQNQNVRLIKFDNITKEVLDRIDVVIHLAGKAHDLKRGSSEEEYFQVNYNLTKQLFDLFSDSQAKKFIYVSSIKAAADTFTGILSEEETTEPKTAYGRSKLKAEEYILGKQISASKSYYILRPCMIHGPGNKGNLSLLFNYLNKGLPYPLGAFKNRRSFLFVDNFSFVISELVSRNIASGVYNLADDEPLGTADLIRLMSQVLDKKVKIWNINKDIINLLANIGDALNLPLNSDRLQKLTENFIVSNKKIKVALKMNMPLSTREGFFKTFKSFN